MSVTARTTLWAGGLIVAITALAYIPAYSSGFIWDDDYYVTENDTLVSVDGLRRIWLELGATPQYYPMVHTSFWIEYHLWRLNPTGYHVVNVLLHAASAVLLWRILGRLGVPGAWWAAAVFAVHPVQVESVAWITERKNVLSGLFYLGAVWAYMRFCPLSATQPAAAKPGRLYALAIVLFLCALLSKTVTCTLPAALFLIVWWKRARIGRADLLPLVPLFIVGIAMGLVTVWMEKHTVGARGQDWGLSALERVLLAGRILWFYAGKLLWPGELIFIYPRWQVDSAAWWQYIYPLAAIAVVVTLFVRRRTFGAGPLVAALFFAGTLLPALGFFDVYPMRFSYVADHFQYLASIGLIALYVGVAATVFRCLPALGGPSGPMTGVAVLIALGVLSGYRQARAFTNAEYLWRDTIAANPGAWMAHNNLGQILAATGRTRQAIPHYRSALRSRPDDKGTRNNLALALVSVGAVDRAIKQHERLVADNPEDPAVYLGLGVALVAAGRGAEAVEQFSKAIEVDPDFIPARGNLGAILVRLGRTDEGIGQLTETLSRDPSFVDAHCNLAVALDGLGRLDEAADHFRQALSLQPGDPHILCALANVLRRQGRQTEAIGLYRQVLTRDPQNARARAGLQAVLKERPGSGL